MHDPHTLTPQPAPDALCPLDLITPWEHQIRPLDLVHVAELQEDIKQHGLLEPLVVDKSYHLIAGHHRLAAIKNLRASDTDSDAFDRWFPGGLIHVSIQPYEAAEAVEHAIDAIIAENFRRREPTRDDVLAIRKVMQTHGQRVGPGGRDKSAENSTELLARRFGVTTRRMKRLLAVPEQRRLQRTVAAAPTAYATEEQPSLAPAGILAAPDPVAEPTGAPEARSHREASLSRLQLAQRRVASLNDAEYEEFEAWLRDEHRCTRVRTTDRE